MAEWAMQTFVMATSGIWWLGFAMQMTFKMVPEPHIENEMDSPKFRGFLVN